MSELDILMARRIKLMKKRITIAYESIYSEIDELKKEKEVGEKLVRYFDPKDKKRHERLLVVEKCLNDLSLFVNDILRTAPKESGDLC